MLHWLVSYIFTSLISSDSLDWKIEASIIYAPRILSIYVYWKAFWYYLNLRQRPRFVTVFDVTQSSFDTESSEDETFETDTTIYENEPSEDDATQHTTTTDEDGSSNIAIHCHPIITKR